MPEFSDPIIKTTAVFIAIAQAGFVVAMAYWASGGKRWLHSHWGGFYDELPLRLRISDAVSGTAFLYGIYAAIASAWDFGPQGFLTVSAWGFVALLGLSSLANFASSSKYERFLFAPVAVLLALCWAIIAGAG